MYLPVCLSLALTTGLTIGCHLVTICLFFYLSIYLSISIHIYTLYTLYIYIIYIIYIIIYICMYISSTNTDSGNTLPNDKQSSEEGAQGCFETGSHDHDGENLGKYSYILHPTRLCSSTVGSSPPRRTAIYVYAVHHVSMLHPSTVPGRLAISYVAFP